MLYSLAGFKPELDEDVYIAPGAHVIGKVKLGCQSSVWFNSVLRGDNAPIAIGKRTNIQDASVIHVNANQPVTIGDEVTIGHNVIIHACTIGSQCLIGMGAIVLDDAQIEGNVIIAAGTLIAPGKRIPAGTLVMGNPGKVVRELTESDFAMIKHTVEHYVKQGALYRSNQIISQ